MATEQLSGAATRSLHVVFSLGHFVAAIESHYIERVVSSDSALIRPRSSGGGIAAMELSTLLELALPVRAWLVLSTPPLGRVALGVGACLGARELSSLESLPDSLFQSRPGALKATFDFVQHSAGAVDRRLGLLLDPLALSSRQDWERAVSELVLDAPPTVEAAP